MVLLEVIVSIDNRIEYEMYIIATCIQIQEYIYVIYYEQSTPVISGMC